MFFLTFTWCFQTVFVKDELMAELEEMEQEELDKDLLEVEGPSSVPLPNVPSTSLPARPGISFFNPFGRVDPSAPPHLQMFTLHRCFNKFRWFGIIVSGFGTRGWFQCWASDLKGAKLLHPLDVKTLWRGLRGSSGGLEGLLSSVQRWSGLSTSETKPN